MIIISKPRILAMAFAAVAVFALSPSPSISAQSESQPQPIVVKEKGIETDTVSSDRMPTAKDGLAPASKPFQKPGETQPAETAIVKSGHGSSQSEINYVSTVARKTSNELILNTTINKMEDDNTLSLLANKIYMENDGPKYDTVTIFWHLGANPEPAAPFARTDVQKDAAVFKITKIDKK